MTMYDMPPEVSAEPACQSQITAAEVTPPPHGRRYYTFDFLKLVCAFLIVCIHALMPGEAGFVSLSLARVAVPTFFAVTGFFYQRTVDRNGGLRQIRKIVLLLVGSVLLYTFWENLLSLHYNGTFAKPQGDIWQYLFSISCPMAAISGTCRQCFMCCWRRLCLINSRAAGCCGLWRPYSSCSAI